MSCEETIDPQSDPYLIDPEELKERIDSARDLIMLPTVAVDAMELANDPDCSIPAFVQMIETDTSLVTDILSLSNSSVYGAKSQIKSVQHAVVCIGTTQCQNLIVSSCVKALSRNLPPSVEWSRDVLWQHNLQTATIARFVNKALRLGFEGEEFSGAMIHDVGRIIIAAAAPDVFDAADRMTFCENASILDHERSLIGTDHCEVGAIFAKTSGLPTALEDVIRFHHHPEDATSNSILVHLIAVADHMANHLMFAGESAGYDAASNSYIDVLRGASTQSVDVEELAANAMQAAEQAAVNTVTVDA
ncbi:HDOD domain-containing protein [Planctomycetota bacterium]